MLQARHIASNGVQLVDRALHDQSLHPQKRQQQNDGNRGREPLKDAQLVIDSADILENPELMLRKLCTGLNISFDPKMLSWEVGPKPFDGVWAKHWYGSVWESTGFAKPSSVSVAIPQSLNGLAEEALGHFKKIKAHALTPHP